ncbi:MAG: OsmC family protein [Syntrophales bacterium]|jgi:uncharacterized OsmC-like protein|nr:OsmC family protein [Syntrophales bacterium]
MAGENILNGINVTQLTETIEAIRKNPEIARFKFRATNRWVEGTHNRATVKDFFGALQEDTSRQPIVFEIDEPPVLLGRNVGPNPVEYVLVGLSGCLTTSLIAHAAARGIEIKGLSTRLEGDLDLRGFLGISEDVTVGYERIRVFFTVDADVSDEKKRELIRMAAKYSPVYNTIANPVAVEVLLDEARTRDRKSAAT